eukprot:1569084-Rhodomonas_salina.1
MKQLVSCDHLQHALGDWRYSHSHAFPGEREAAYEGAHAGEAGGSVLRIIESIGAGADVWESYGNGGTVEKEEDRERTGDRATAQLPLGGLARRGSISVRSQCAGEHPTWMRTAQMPGNDMAQAG